MLRGGSRTAATSKIERFVIIVNDFQLLIITAKHSIFDVTAVLDPHQSYIFIVKQRFASRFGGYQQSIKRVGCLKTKSLRNLQLMVCILYQHCGLVEFYILLCVTRIMDKVRESQATQQCVISFCNIIVWSAVFVFFINRCLIIRALFQIDCQFDYELPLWHEFFSINQCFLNTK